MFKTENLNYHSELLFKKRGRVSFIKYNLGSLAKHLNRSNAIFPLIANVLHRLADNTSYVIHTIMWIGDKLTEDGLEAGC